MNDYITVIGGGLAGSEAAYQIAKKGIKVIRGFLKNKSNNSYYFYYNII